MNSNNTASKALEVDGTETFEHRESRVRSYCRAFPAVFVEGRGARLWDEEGKEYLDFFAGAGALNYGHNHPVIKERVREYIDRDGLMHALDCYTDAKRTFLARFGAEILDPRGLPYRAQFIGPTGTDAVEAALKLARRVTGRTRIVAFTGAYHGVSLGSLATTADRSLRRTAGVQLEQVTHIPFPMGPRGHFPAAALLEQLLDDDLGGMEVPAAVIIEPVQMEGGVYEAPPHELRALRRVCDRFGILLIADEIQSGCGRCGSFFSFERAKIVPDLVTVSKSISGFGLPMSLLLLREELDQWEPGEHPGTFRGNQLAFVAASGALDLWRDGSLLEGVRRREDLVRTFWSERNIPNIEVRGAGLAFGIDMTARGGGAAAQSVADQAFTRGLIIETTGRGKAVIKLMPPLNIELDDLRTGCELLAELIERTPCK